MHGVVGAVRSLAFERLHKMGIIVFVQVQTPPAAAVFC